ncbi:Acylphosphatase [Westerdykella ornata]|uniref:Acylphosphatase n=1 Tax=Westerdykella ornata TaxID=318751 RepID=A0A6A6JCL3_WESOR|nr:Acylphosphatase [Westerdykella ornata]KAF2274007.1 Acylphosphatase [Westerdykella ornata]
MQRFFSTTARMSSKRISFKVDGYVQGVNFRSFTQKQANKLGLTGFVRNASDGTVQGEAQGSDETLEDFLQHLHSGPRAATVTGVEHSDMPTKAGESNFSVVR